MASGADSGKVRALGENQVIEIVIFYGKAFMFNGPDLTTFCC
jgi:hypothetical protein